jgi:hypothetical protein
MFKKQTKLNGAKKRKNVYKSNYMDRSDTNLHAVVYVSSSSVDYSQHEMESILNDVRTYNRTHDITGLLIFGGGNMLRMMEGTKETVQAQYHLMQEDNEQDGAIKLLDKPIKHRYFGDYPMAFKALNSQNLKHFDDFKEPESKDFFDECLATDDSVMKLVKDFLKHNT